MSALTVALLAAQSELPTGKASTHGRLTVTSERSTLFADVRETLEVFGSEAANADDLSGSEIAASSLSALDKIEKAVREAYHRPVPGTDRWFCQVCRKIGGHTASCPASLYALGMDE